MQVSSTIQLGRSKALPVAKMEEVELAGESVLRGCRTKQQGRAEKQEGADEQIHVSKSYTKPNRKTKRARRINDEAVRKVRCSSPFPERISIKINKK